MACSQFVAIVLGAAAVATSARAQAPDLVLLRERPVSCAPRIGPGAVTLKATTITQLVGLLSRFVNRVVMDRTSLSGMFDVDLRWMPPPGEWVAPGVDLPQVDGPSLFAAIKEDLGLKLEPMTSAVDVLVIDHAEKPTSNSLVSGPYKRAGLQNSCALASERRETTLE